MDKKEYLLKSLGGSIQHFITKRKYFRLLTHFFRISIIVFSSGLTVLAGIQIKEQSDLISIMILCVSAAITVISSINNIYKPNDSWIQLKRNTDDLRTLKKEIEFSSAGENIEIEEYFDRYLEILNENTNHWVKTRISGEKSWNKEYAMELLKAVKESKDK